MKLVTLVASFLLGFIAAVQGAECGDGAVDPDTEECEPGDRSRCDSLDEEGYVGGQLFCNEDCTYDKSSCVSLPTCGNGELDPAEEECEPGKNGEPAQLGGHTCQTIRDGYYMGGELGCLNNCLFDHTNCERPPLATCRNGKLDDGEECEGTDFNGETCATWSGGLYSGGALICDDCTIKTDLCLEACGNFVVEDYRPFNEQCEPSDLRGETCESLGYGGGELGCSEEYCQFDFNWCTQECGNGVLEPGHPFDDAYYGVLEECDGTDLGDMTCEKLHWSFSGGELGCNSNCEFNTTQCITSEERPADTPGESTGGSPANNPDDGDSGCFSGLMHVSVLQKGSVAMKDLQVNDEVHVGNDKNGLAIYQSVYSFGHYAPTSPVKYIQLFHSKDNGEPLELSDAHFIFLAGSSAPIRADAVQLGDKVSVVNKKHGTTEDSTVTKIDSIVRSGAYLPLTRDGTIVVNGIAASTYVSIDHNSPEIVRKFGVSQQDLFHWWLAPYRMVCMGLSTKLCENDYNEEGIIHWLVFGQWLAEVGEKSAAWVQVVGIGIVASFLTVFASAETFFGPQLGWIGILLSLCAVASMMRGSKKEVRDKKAPVKVD